MSFVTEIKCRIVRVAAGCDIKLFCRMPFRRATNADVKILFSGLDQNHPKIVGCFGEASSISFFQVSGMMLQRPNRHEDICDLTI